ncbi:MAG TPA: PilC/PilY family type IV pilus protein [Steroidobacteraceae bacterium]|nr:PilC/PilY family type IV pilus protein [Steroidobacteraceae bacterium]
MNTKHLMAGLTLLCAVLAQRSHAQAAFKEDFTGATTTNSWYYFNGACLTASSAAVGTPPGQLPGCLAVKSAYYFGENLVGGTNGVSGTAQTLPDPANTGALRFTNGAPYGNNEGGAIVSAVPFDTSNGVQITFKSISYRGDSGGGTSDGADGISFFLVDGATIPSIGSQGGSLSYTCSNPGNIGGHPVIDGVAGGYLGLGIDEYGNFLNAGDNTATGFGQQGGRIGLRGAGNVAWSYLNAKYPIYYPTSLTPAQQQLAVANTCQSGYLWDYSNPASPTPVSGTLVTGKVAGKVARGSYVLTLIPLPMPISVVIGATITDPLGYIPANTTIVSTGTATIAGVTTGTITMSNPGNSGAKFSGNAEVFSYSSGAAGSIVTIPDYPAIPGGYSVLSGVKIANESAMKRGDATPIFYNLRITPNGLLSLSYSLSGAAYQSILAHQDITTYNGAMPDSFLFGFAGSTGGSTNIHEIMCFQAAATNTSGSSATVNEKESAKVETTTQAFFAFYNPGDWTGTVTANTLIDTAGVVTIATVANWDASCMLTGTDAGLPAVGGGCATTNTAGPTSPTPNSSSTGRVMLTWDTSNNVGIPFEWTSLNSNQQAALDALDGTLNGTRLSFLRGNRSNEVNSAGVGLYRSRASLLGDIVDSSPTWVGPPILPYTATWTDRLQSTDSMVENSGTQNYLQYTTAEQSRLNVVYVGANDGFLHGFRAGSVDSNGNLVTTTTPNDGQEVLAYMPGSTLQSAAKATVPATAPPNCTDHSHTQTVVQNIHGVTPAISSNPLCVDSSLDFASPKYGHNFFVDATPGTGDLFYGGVWHTWLVGGLGTGGAAIYALDITNPVNFTEGNASSVVVGEWNASTLHCSPSCDGNLGNTFGTPQIRRLHNGKWGVIFGNGFGSTSGDAGIYVMSIDASSGTPVATFYYLSTHTGTASPPCASNCNGIAYVTAADLDGDHVTDYAYAGDLKGNVWRFDLTSTDPTQWAAAASPLFTTPSGQPISTQMSVVSTAGMGGQRLMIEFATGQRTQVTNTTTVSYASGTQAIYGVWDWNMSSWNTMSTMQYASLAPAATGFSAPYTIPSSGSPITSLAQQVFTLNASGVSVDGTNNAVCWKGSTACTGGAASNAQFGWYATLPGSSEQVIFNPVYFQGALLVDSTIPSPSNYTPTSCNAVPDTGFTYAISVANGGTFTKAFPGYTKNGTLVNDSTAAGVQTNATGSVYVVSTVEGKSNIIYQTVSGSPSSQQVNIPPNTKSKRLTWVEKR